MGETVPTQTCAHMLYVVWSYFKHSCTWRGQNDSMIQHTLWVMFAFKTAQIIRLYDIVKNIRAGVRPSMCANSSLNSSGAGDLSLLCIASGHSVNIFTASGSSTSRSSTGTEIQRAFFLLRHLLCMSNICWMCWNVEHPYPRPVSFSTWLHAFMCSHDHIACSGGRKWVMNTNQIFWMFIGIHTIRTLHLSPQFV